MGKLKCFLTALCLLWAASCAGGDYAHEDVSGQIKDIMADDTDNLDFSAEAYSETDVSAADEAKALKAINAAADKKDKIETIPVMVATESEAKIAGGNTSGKVTTVEIIKREPAERTVSAAPVSTKSESRVESIDLLVSNKPAPEEISSKPRMPTFEEAVKEAERRNPDIVLARDNEYFAKNRKAWQGAKLNIKDIEAAGFKPMLEATEIKEEKEPSVTFLATIIYHGDGAYDVTAEDRKALSEVARFWKDKGGEVRVIGHASHRTRNMNIIDHKTTNLKVSTDRAIKVSAELARLGVPSGKISVGAVADNETVSPENMPVNEAQNRRTEVYIAY